mmetsp:Transcript_17845/g.19877  ORF Transcript_17845/g.19877 Transcript_17845/m.19877 type:complete len:115 (+) Transcript_17845:30-374(+)
MPLVGHSLMPGMKKCTFNDYKKIEFKVNSYGDQDKQVKKALQEQNVSLDVKHCCSLIGRALPEHKYKVAKYCAKYCHDGEEKFVYEAKRQLMSWKEAREKLIKKIEEENKKDVM